MISKERIKDIEYSDECTIELAKTLVMAAKLRKENELLKVIVKDVDDMFENIGKTDDPHKVKHFYDCYENRINLNLNILDQE